ncbi:hypothetical protein SAMN05660653_00689 [Desulfonatronum thiosulfatophilum]|uniref:Uncharacterized protein n=1 Tax=Desulfonatronum thiosulfatophilum TaxID=617002 RepID=A0A1G6AZR4_9BACT|nr:hypothetical protein [Desulfonatronum thiosulfatophilum]SDB13896.1 hypothetical protein SAMN05660653_00689 [Desulfonatronum thiosulfatophilum]
MNDIHGYLESWRKDPGGVRPVVTRLFEQLQKYEPDFEFVVREGVSASLRARVRKPGTARPLFCLVDIVEDADGRWLSVCFYADTVSDSNESGNLVPEGLLGEDGYCFDVDGADAEYEGYLFDRIAQAHAAVLAGNS